jgi:proteasome lid subunit RPN8/RPN11
MISEKLQTEILTHVKAEYPKEACGLIVIIKGKERYIPCTNLAENVYDDFILDPKDYYKASKMGDVINVIHSHPNGTATPSILDQSACDAMGKNWWIVSYPEIEWRELTSAGKKPDLIGRNFAYGILDCYTLLQDYFKINCNLILRDYEHEWEFWEKGQHLYTENFEKEGFIRVTDGSLKLHDIVLMNIRSNITNHAGIYLGNEKILHHLAGRLSCREMYGSYYRQYTTHTIRHEKYY